MSRPGPGPQPALRPMMICMALERHYMHCVNTVLWSALFMVHIHHILHCAFITIITRACCTFYVLCVAFLKDLQKLNIVYERLYARSELIN